MKFRWNPEKSEQLLMERGVSFEQIYEAIQNGFLIKDEPHPDRERYPHQRIFTVILNGYACIVPYVTDNETIFLKTVFHSRKANKQYAGVKKDGHSKAN